MQKSPKLLNENRKKMDELCQTYRGEYIHAAVQIEVLINTVLSEYFCGHNMKKRKEIYYGLFNSERITLSHKIQLVQFVYRSNFKEFDKKHNLDLMDKFKNRSKEEKRKNPNAKKPATLDTKLDEFVSTRNKLAHRYFYNDLAKIEAFDGENISLDTIRIKEGGWNGDELILSKSEVRRYKNYVREISDCLKEVIGLINAKDTNQTP